MTASPSDPPGRFQVTLRGKAYVLSGGRYTLGRSETSTFVLDDDRTSRCHARLVADDVLTVEDLASANGTFVNGARLLTRTPHPLRTGDTILVGTTEITVGAGAGPALPAPDRGSSGAHYLAVMAARSEGQHTRRTDPLQLIGEVADRALGAGLGAEAARIAGPQVERVLAEVRRGGKVHDLQVDWAIRYALRLAAATKSGAWLDSALSLYRERGMAPSTDEQVVTIERLVDQVDSVDLRGFDATLDRWRALASKDPRVDQTRIRRVESLYGKVAHKARGGR